MFLGHRLMADGTELTPDQVAKRTVFGSGSWFGWYWEIVLHTRAEQAAVGSVMGVPKRSACQGRLGLQGAERLGSSFQAWRKQGIEGPHSEPRFSQHMRCRYFWSAAEWQQRVVTHCHRGRCSPGRRVHCPGAKAQMTGSVSYRDSSEWQFLAGFRLPGLPGLQNRAPHNTALCVALLVLQGTARLLTRRLRVFVEFAFGDWQLVAILGDPHIQRRQQENTEQERADEAANDDDGEGPLRV